MSWIHGLAFVAGAAILVLEIVGTRVISPVFGSTIYVWSALITVTLAALAAGYAAGGSLADRRSPERAVVAVLATAGVWLLVSPWLRQPLLVWTAALGVRLGALVSASLLFGLPLACLGAVGPLCVRLRTRDLARLGREVGNLGSISTVGSVGGALAAGYFLVPRVAVSRLLAGLAVLLLALAASTAWRCRRRVDPVQPPLLALLTLAATASLTLRHPPPGSPAMLERVQGFVGEIEVVEPPGSGRRALLIDGVTNTAIDTTTMDSTSDYIAGLELAPMFRPGARRALLIGLGGGVLVGRYARDYGIQTDVVEIDPAVVPIAKRWFGFVPSGDVTIGDGRRVLAAGDGRYDLIVIDAFNGDQHPYHLFSREAFATAARRLTPGGLLALNTIGYARGPRAELTRSLALTLRRVFPHVRLLVANRDVRLDRQLVNLLWFASDGRVELGRDPATARPALARYWSAVEGQFLQPTGGSLITDDRNPIESLSGPAFLALRTRLIRYWRHTLAD